MWDLKLEKITNFESIVKHNKVTSERNYSVTQLFDVSTVRDFKRVYDFF